MDLKKLFPVSYKKSILVGVLTYLVVAIVASALIWFAGLVAGWIPVVGAIVGWVLRIVGILVDIYVVVGIVLNILVGLNIIK